MLLSSTIRTLIGGTVPSIRPPKAPLKDSGALVFFGFAEDVEGRGRGDAPRAGGVRDLV